jgi:sugar/nucleoside kinase (ribokinase family)
VSNTTPTIACLGQASIDTIRKGKKTVRGLLGGAAVYSATVAARLHARVGICALIGSDFPPKFVEFISAQGVGISGLHQRRGASTRITLVYQGQRLKGVSVKTGVSRHLESLHIPLSYRTCRFFHVCPSPYKTQLNTTLAMKKRGAHVSLDPHADFNNARFELVSKILSHVDTLFVNNSEALAITRTPSAADAAYKLLDAGPTLVIVTNGKQGATIFRKGDTESVPAIRPNRVVDVVGAGDAFAAGFLTGLSKRFDPFSAAMVGAACASCVIEDFGMRKLPTLDRVNGVLRSTVGKEL